MQLSFVFPCLNEEETLGDCIREVRNSLDSIDVSYEIIVADNGSTDSSTDIARSLNVTVVSVPERGYGAALRGGIRAARGQYIMFADADGSYLLEDAAGLYQTAVEQAADMAVASRMQGTIEPGAMPFLHRRVGTPVLTSMINLFFGGNLSDCNSGFRCIRGEAYQDWDVRADGMEFASELLIKALKHDADIVEIPSGLRPDRRTRPPYLSTWRDGMRHLLFIFSEKPGLFELLGLLLMLIPSLLQVAAFMTGPLALGPFEVFDYHSQALLLLPACIGSQMYLFSCYLYLAGDELPATRITRKLIRLDEGHLFFLLISLGMLQMLGIVYVFWRWSQVQFRGFDMIRMMLFATHFLCISGFVTVGLLGIHVFKKRSR